MQTVCLVVKIRFGINMFKYVLTIPKRIVLIVQSLVAVPFMSVYVIFTEDSAEIKNHSWFVFRR